MPTLTEERIADRDRNMTAFDRAANRGSVIDRLRGGDVKQERLALDQSKFGYQQAKDAFDQAAKSRELEMKAGALQQRADVAEQRMSIAEKLAALDSKRADISERASQLRIDQDLAKTTATERAIEAGEFYFSKAATLDPYAPDFPEKFADLKRKTLAASENDDVKKHTDYLLKEREKSDAYNMSFAPKAPDEQKASAADLRSLERERALYATEFSKARARRGKYSKEDYVDKKAEIDAADADVSEYQSKLTEAESQLRSLRGDGPAKTDPAAPAASERVAVNPKTGERVVLRDGAWVPMK